MNVFEQKQGAQAEPKLSWVKGFWPTLVYNQKKLNIINTHTICHKYLHTIQIEHITGSKATDDYFQFKVFKTHNQMASGINKKSSSRCRSLFLQLFHFGYVITHCFILGFPWQIRKKFDISYIEHSTTKSKPCCSN